MMARVLLSVFFAKKTRTLLPLSPLTNGNHVVGLNFHFNIIFHFKIAEIIIARLHSSKHNVERR